MECAVRVAAEIPPVQQCNPLARVAPGLVHSGWDARRALLYNLLSALTLPLGGLAACFLSCLVEPTFLVAFGAGNFLYIGAGMGLLLGMSYLSHGHS